MKTIPILVAIMLSGCVAYPAYYPAPAGQADPYRAQRIANEQCAKSGKTAVQINEQNCNAANCTTAFECR